MGKSSNWDGLYCSDAIADITKLYRKILHRLLNSVILRSAILFGSASSIFLLFETI